VGQSQKARLKEKSGAHPHGIGVGKNEVADAGYIYFVRLVRAAL